MIANNLEKLLEKRGKKLLWLANEIGVGYQRLQSHFHNEATMIRYETLERICVALDCGVGDLLEIREPILRLSAREAAIDMDARTPTKQKMYGFAVGQTVRTLVSLRDEVQQEVKPGTLLQIIAITKKPESTDEIAKKHPKLFDRKDYSYVAVRAAGGEVRVRANFVTIQKENVKQQEAA